MQHLRKLNTNKNRKDKNTGSFSVGYAMKNVLQSYVYSFYIFMSSIYFFAPVALTNTFFKKKAVFENSIWYNYFYNVCYLFICFLKQKRVTLELQVSQTVQQISQVEN